MISCTASAAPDLYRLATEIAQLVNAHVHWDMRQMDDLERRALIVELKAEFEELAS